MEKLSVNLDGFRKSYAPVAQAHRTPVAQAHRTPVAQAHRTPVAQAPRNTIETQYETHSQTQASARENFTLSENQKKWLCEKCQTTMPEVEKALRIIEQSSPKPKNIMGYLLKTGFFGGECILEPTTEEAELTREELNNRTEQARVKAWGDAVTDKMRNPLLAALAWYQNLAADLRAKVQANILRTRPSLRDQFEGKHPFGPLMLVLLREERRKLHEQGLI